MDDTVTFKDPTKIAPITPIDPSIKAGDIGNVTGLNLKTPTQPTNLLEGLLTTAQTTANDSTAKQTTEENTYTNLLNQLGMQTADTQALQQEKGVTTAEKELVDLQKVANKQQADYIAGYVQAEGRHSIGTLKNAEQAQINRQHGIDALLTNSLISAKQGDITYANTLVDRAIAAKYDPIKAKIEAQKFILDQINSKASEDRKRYLDLQMKNLDKVSDFQKTALNNAILRNAPQDVLSKISNANSIKDILDVGSQYLSSPKDSLDMELTKAQIAKAWADARKVDTSSGTLTDTQLKNIDNSPQGKKLTLLSGLYQKSQTYKNLVDTYGFKASGPQKTLIDNAYADLKIAYKTAAELGALTGPDVGLIEEAIKPSSGGAGNYLKYKIGGGQGGVSGGIEQALTKAKQEALNNYKQLTSRNPEYAGSEYVKSLVTPFAKDYSTLDITKVPVGEIIQTEDGALLESLGNGKFSPL